MIELSDKSSPLNSTTIYPKCNHTLYSVLITENKIAVWISPLPWAHFVFLFLLLQVRSLITFITCLPTTPWTSSCSTTWIGPSYLVTHLDARISTNRFHQLAKTKLGLSTWHRWLGWMMSHHGGREKCECAFKKPYTPYPNVGSQNDEQFLRSAFPVAHACRHSGWRGYGNGTVAKKRQNRNSDRHVWGGGG